MHFITGGAHNGKAKWVKEFYRIEDRMDYEWFNCYDKAVIPKDLNFFESIVVLEGIEQVIFSSLKVGQFEEMRGKGRGLINRCLAWEQERKERQVIIIGADITKGIVPMDLVERQWRDVTGWFYQDLVEKVDRVDQIWYGINKRLK